MSNTIGTTEPKKIYIRVDVPEVVQTFDFKNDGDLGWTGYAGQYGTPAYASGQGWYIGSGTGSYESHVIPPSNIYSGTLKSYKIWFNKSATTTNSIGQATGISTTVYGVQYSRFGGTGGRIVGPGGVTSAVDVTGDVTLEFIFEAGQDLIVKINDTNEYNIGNYSDIFMAGWQNQDLNLILAKRAAYPFYVSKVEITTI